MARRTPRVFLLALLVSGLLLGSARAAPIVTGGSGALASDIQDEVDAFRAAVGNPNNGNAAGPLGSGRREINWDGGGATTPTVSAKPFNGFLNNRGVSLTTPGTSFIQGSPEALATQFGHPSYATTFAPFSASRLFTPIGSNVTDVTFFVPGTNGAAPATVSAFGSVFSDVDFTTTLQFFNAANASLGEFPVPTVPGQATLSFLGVRFDAGEQIARVRITTGGTSLGIFDDSPIYDLAVMDDFIFSEPVPEPGALALVALGLAGLGVAGRRRLS